MYKRLFFAILIIVSVVNTKPAQAVNELILEAATGVASESMPFSSGWKGSVGEGGLLYREFAVRIKYRYNPLLTISTTFGILKDWKKPRYVLYFDRPDLWYQLEAKREFVYLRPTIRLSAKQLRFDLGMILLIENADSLRNKTEFYIFNGEKSVFPVMGIELGENNGYIYAGFVNSFPLVSGGGVIEMGIAGRWRGIYEHKFFTAISGYQDISLGYRGEFRVYKQIAITPGFSIGGRDRDNVYLLTFGLKWILNRRNMIDN